MSQTTPLPKPQPATIQALNPPTYRQPSFWLGILAGIPAVVALLADKMPEIIQRAGPLLNDQWRLKLTLLAFIIGLFRTTAAKHEQSQATGRVAELTPTMPPTQE